MNRLILIGNGFDLAHGMRTSYRDFIFNYLKEACQSAFNTGDFKDGMLTIKKQETSNPKKLEQCKSFKDLVKLFIRSTNFSAAFGTNVIDDYDYDSNARELLISNPHKFISALFSKCQTMNWVDIEDEYYTHLKYYLTLQGQDKQSRIISLNKIMAILSNHIKEYMSKQVPLKHIYEYKHILQEKILITDLALDFIKENETPKDKLIVNFNYTDTIYNYTDDSIVKVNFIHGRIKDHANPIIFGFGDELDADYSKLEEAKEKGFLDYMKSFGYFKTSNYHNLIRFISSDDYQVYILGHSCGLSDRTMLNMIFEHDNCKSIKIFYHETNGKNNYTELTQEISRHFYNKGKMRERIVSLDKSFPMPQCSS